MNKYTTAFQETTEKYREEFPGTFGRKVLRNSIRKGLSPIGNNKGSMIGKMRPRRVRREAANNLNVPFNPKYNANYNRLVSELKEVENKKGKTYLKRVTELVKVG